MMLATAATLLLTGSACADTQILSHRVLDEGQFSAITERRYEIIDNERDWAALWFEHQGLEQGVRDLPEIDFKQEMVLATFMGPQPNYGNRIFVDMVAEHDSRCAAKIGEEIARVGPRVYTTPFQFSAVSRTDLPVWFLDREHRIETLDRGSDCDQDQPQTQVIRDRKTWQQIWDLTFHKSMAPAVDFETEMVLAVFLGDQPTSGHSVRIVDASEAETEAGTVLVPIALHRTPTEAALPIITSPYHFVVTPASDLPVSFQTIDF